VEPVGGLGVSGGGLWRAGHGEQGRAAGGRGGGGAPAALGDGELAEKLHRGTRKVAGGSVGGEAGRRRGFRGGLWRAGGHGAAMAGCARAGSDLGLI